MFCKVELLEKWSVNLKFKNCSIIKLLDLCLTLTICDRNGNKLWCELAAYSGIAVFWMSHDEVFSIEWHRLDSNNWIATINSEALSWIEFTSVSVYILNALLRLTILLFSIDLCLIGWTVDDSIFSKEIFIRVVYFVCNDFLARFFQ